MKYVATSYVAISPTCVILTHNLQPAEFLHTICDYGTYSVKKFPIAQVHNLHEKQHRFNIITGHTHGNFNYVYTIMTMILTSL